MPKIFITNFMCWREFWKDEEILEEITLKALVRSKLGNTVQRLEHILSCSGISREGGVKNRLLSASQWSATPTSFALTKTELSGILVSKSAAAHQQINIDFTLVKDFPLRFSPRCHFHSLYKLTYTITRGC